MTEIKTYFVQSEETLVDVLVNTGLAANRSEARLYIAQGAVTIEGIDGRVVPSPTTTFTGHCLVRVGNYKRVKIETASPDVKTQEYIMHRLEGMTELIAAINNLARKLEVTQVKKEV